MTDGWIASAGHIVVAVRYTTDTIAVHDPYSTWNDRYKCRSTQMAFRVVSGNFQKSEHEPKQLELVDVGAVTVVLRAFLYLVC